MPELPEVESARKLVAGACAGKAITSVVAVESGGGPRDGLFDDSVFDGVPDAAAVQAALLGRTLLACHRRGKQQWWTLSGAGPHPTFHFGMTGNLVLRRPDGSTSATEYKETKVDLAVWPPRFCKLLLGFADGTQLAFTDPRRFGRIGLEADPAASARVAGLGRDVHTHAAEITAAWFAAGLAAKKAAPVKAALLDQSWLAGVGNYLADEALYQAGVHPEAPCSGLAPAQAEALRTALLAVVAHAVAVDADATKFPPSWLFHYRWGKGKGAAMMPDGNAIEFVTVGGRTSAVVRAVQGTGGGAKRAGKAANAAAATASKAAAATAVVAAASGGGSSSSSSSSSAAATDAAAAPPAPAARKRKAASPQAAASTADDDAAAAASTSAPAAAPPKKKKARAGAAVAAAEPAPAATKRADKPAASGGAAAPRPRRGAAAVAGKS